MRGPVPHLLVMALAGTFIPVTATAQSTAKFYEENCAVCHTIGDGDQAGPDLKGALQRRDREWLIRFLLDPEGMIARGDEYAVRSVAAWGGFVMPATDGLTRHMAEELVEYIDRESRHTRSDTARPIEPFTAADHDRGLAIFTGRVPLANGGASCMSCHAVAPIRGGSLGPDLTAAHTRLGGATGTMAWLANPPTPVMRALYRRTGFTEDETRSLAALLERSAAANAVTQSDTRRWLLLTGLAGAFAALMVIGIMWRGRFRSVRRRLVDQMARPKAARSMSEGNTR